MKCRALVNGYDNLRLRHRGEVFEWHGSKPPSWAEKLPDPKPKAREAAKPNEAAAKK